MDVLQRILGEKRLALLEQLKEEKTFVKMQIPSVAYEQLTLIIDIRTKENSPYFIIDPPKDFDKVEKKIYINHYLEDFKLSLKIPIEKSEIDESHMKIEKFQLNHTVYLMNF